MLLGVIEDKMKKIFTIMIFSMLLLSVNLVFAHEHNFDETKQIVDSGISCDKLTNEQLESIGDYYMEQMHPGEAHEIMDEMMGGEDSESLKQVHIQMAKRMYCNEDTDEMMGGGMMDMMMGSGGMMNGMGTNMMGSGVMGNYLADYYGYNNFEYFLVGFFIAIILLIIWLVYKFTKKQEEFETPVSIIKKRYAEGKINKKQFEEMQKELKE